MPVGKSDKPPYWKFRNLKEDGSLEITLYEPIGEGVFTSGETAKKFATRLKRAGKSVTDIQLRINSPGGNVYDGLGIYNTLVNHPAKVTAHVDGLAASIASVIAMAADEIRMPENALMMVHDPFGSVFGTAEDMEKTAEALRKVKDSIISTYRTKTGMADEEISSLMSEETWMSARDAVDLGFADTLVEPVQFVNVVNALNATPDDLRFHGAIVRSESDEGEIEMSDEQKYVKADITAAFLVKTLPEVVNELLAGNPVDHSSAVQQERERIQAVLDGALPGHEALARKHAFEDCLTPEQSAIAILRAEREKRETVLDKLEKESPAPATPSVSTEVVENSMAPEDKLKFIWNQNRSYRGGDKVQEQFLDYEDFAAFEAAQSAGLVRMLHQR